MTREQYIKNTLELNVFYARVFKEHCVALVAGLKNGDMRILQSLDRYKVHFEMLLNSALDSGLNLIDSKLVEHNCFITPYTHSLELSTQNACGVSINHRITTLQAERLSKPQPIPAGRLPFVYERAMKLNSDGEEIAQGLSELIRNILNEIVIGRIYSSIYPAIFERNILELKRYQKAIEFIRQDNQLDYCDDHSIKIMQTNAEYIRGALDFKEEQDIQKANTFVIEFAQCVSDKEKFLKTNQEFAQFLQELIEKITAKKLMSIMLPLTFDNILRQANYNIALLTTE